MVITRDYEALVIFKAVGTEQDIARLAAQLEALVKKLDGTIAASQNLGRRRLAYRIARQTEGYYHLLRFCAPTGQVAELERLLRLNEAIVRFMILGEDELTPMSNAQPLGTGQTAAAQFTTSTRS